ncbi:hypothetical protein OWR29_23530 [Actinoplanes sp. Pm04-4]|uniref:Lipoprotein n=1 Tax=Paractinoplanes pyxinae TaxID=2997416 RepID=A0ABT4B397_9ACTN|nr:hypothetical protein [Actinoplanes pyxinae]MCY1140979.1 hypothetical protein [Actinoplanes pyxinae]
MIMRSSAALALLVLAAGCGQPATTTAVPAGCDPTADHLTWSPSTTTPTLTNATLFTGGRETTLIDEPYKPSITGVDAPAEWLNRLATSLQKTAGPPVRANSPEPIPTDLRIAAPAELQMIVYTGVDRVAADFEIRCHPTIRGTFHGWSTATTGVVSCNNYQPTLPDAFGSLALKLCPPPTAEPSADSADAIPFPEVTPGG